MLIIIIVTIIKIYDVLNCKNWRSVFIWKKKQIGYFNYLLILQDQKPDREPVTMFSLEETEMANIYDKWSIIFWVKLTIFYGEQIYKYN